TLTLKPTPRTENGDTAGTLDFTPDYGGFPVVIHDITPGSPALDAGLQVGDRILAVGGEPVKSAAQVTSYIHEHTAQAIHLTIERGSQAKEITTDTRRLADGVLGIRIADEFPFRKAGFPGAAKYAVQAN